MSIVIISLVEMLVYVRIKLTPSCIDSEYHVKRIDRLNQHEIYTVISVFHQYTSDI